MNQLADSIEQLYQVFGRYTSEGMFYCDCGCIDKADVDKLMSKSLRELKEDDLASYHGSAMYTWGSEEHYKHFLPRICELRAVGGAYAFIDLSEIYNKLDHAIWKKWPIDEQEAINNYVKLDWLSLVNSEKNDIDVGELEEYLFYIPLAELLRMWNVDESDIAMRKFVHFLFNNGNQIVSKGIKLHKELFQQEFIDAIIEKRLNEKLEKVFFEVEEKEPEYGIKLSAVLQIIEELFS